MTITDPYAGISTRRTPQSEQADSRQVKNSAGGYTFELDDTARLRRFLILGSDGPTYYTSAAELTKDNAAVVLRMARENATGLTDLLLDVSLAGRAPKQNPTLFALAAACSLGDDDGRAYALAALPRIARTGTHLFLFARYIEQFRGWGRGLRRAVERWYSDKDLDSLCLQLTKYRQREGWSHRDLLRLSHPTATGPGQAAAFNWVAGRETEELPDVISAFVRAQAATTADEWVKIIDAAPILTWEMLPDAALSEPKVWQALLSYGMPMTALIRQLPRLTRLGVAKSSRGLIALQLTNEERLRKARVHPVNVLVAQRTYASGHSARGESEWTPERVIVDALDEAFYKAFGAVEPAGKRTLLALDVSGSMAMTPISNMPLTPREASAAMALVTAATEPDYDIVGFTSGQPNRGFYMNAHRMREVNSLVPLTISPRQRLDDAIGTVSDLEFGPTDCALPMLWALEKGERYETFVIYTDNETWAGNVHPHQALERYRRETGIAARLVVVGMTSTGFSVADPTDAGSLDIVGFDSATPNLIADFSRGDV